MGFKFSAVLFLLLIAAGCSSSKSRDDGSGDANIDNARHQVADRKQPEGIRTAKSGPQKEQSMLQEARAALAAGEHESAGDKVRDYLLAHPGDASGLFLAAKIEAHGARYLDAVALLDEIPRDHPEAGLAALGQSADWMMVAEQWDEAEARYNALLKKVPTANMAHRRLAYLLNRQGRRQEASSHVRFLCRTGDVSQSELHTLINQCEAIYDEARDGDWSFGWFAPIGPQAEARVLFSKHRIKKALDPNNILSRGAGSRLGLTLSEEEE